MTLLRRVIGRALRRARRDQGKTLRDVAETARVSVQYLSEVERGRKEASSEVLAAICAAHGWTLLDLLDQVSAELRAEHAGAVRVGAERVGAERVGASVHVLPGRDRVVSAPGAGVRLAA